ncbi:hypothetical protein D8674_016021 [Pyrus ussuriensis x Pyrus communis]|uniref:Uncharacterized protein n=1 Tax=Pyrus ussuriensis x Pyrus communis TaxID=2448454 RepID=A0A5N5HDU9_9ROSA|nr:hypothetical protein D8674_042988 [Pyrus ussuriensis x Pyrus communis]KAB2624361.1 hypothetical protein D8674_016021 [Pyrus ussuriensis x Pyrus communis]
MASLKQEKPAGTQPTAGQAKKEPAPKACGTTPKACGTTPKAPASKPDPKTAETKPRELKKRTTGSKPAAKN